MKRVHEYLETLRETHDVIVVGDEILVLKKQPKEEPDDG
jgi:hypothetical protein